MVMLLAAELILVMNCSPYIRGNSILFDRMALPVSVGVYVFFIYNFLLATELVKVCMQ